MTLTATEAGWIQASAVLLVLFVLHIPLGDYIARRLGPGPADPGRTPHWRVERLVYRLSGVDPEAEQDWRHYLRSLLALSGAGVLVLYAILRLQQYLPYSEGRPGLSPALAWDTAVSFVTNTSWQNYSPEATTGYVAVIAGLGIEAFVSAAVGLAVSLALIRGLTRRQSQALGNFWVDLTRSITRVLLPLSVVAGLLLMWLGVAQTWDPSAAVHQIAAGTQPLPLGPVATWEPVKLLSGDGGGFFAASSGHPLENPNGASNALEILLMLLVPVAMLRAYGRIVGDTRQGWALLAVASTVFLLMALGTSLAESHLSDTASAVAGSTMNGKEVRFGQNGSSLFGITATSTADGAGNPSYDSFSAYGGGLLLSAMMLGEISPGGVGSGLYGLLMIALIAVFLGGLMVGRTPEFLGKRISAREMRQVALYYLSVPMVLLTGTAIAMALPGERARMNNTGAHGFTEVLYAFTSSANSNGSAFAGLGGNTTWYNVALGLVMVFGRYLPMIFVLALAGALARQKPGPVTAGTLRTTGPMFIGLTTASALVLVGLTFLPALALGPLADGLHG